MRSLSKIIFLSILLSIVLLVPFPAAGALPVTPAITSPFQDLAPEDANFLFIKYLASRGLVKGLPSGKFQPAAGLTRAEAAALLVRVAGLKTNFTQSRFLDVTKTHWAVGSIEAASSAGILRGYPDGTFRPGNKLTRAEGISLFLRLASQPNPEVLLPLLTDIGVRHWAARPVAVGLAAGLVGLSSDQKRFLPDAPLSRGDMARVLALLVTTDPILNQTGLSNRLKVTGGTVTVTTLGSKVPEEIKNETEIKSGDIIQTGKLAKAELIFPDGSGVLLGENTQLTLKESRGKSYIKADGSVGTAIDWLNLELKYGKLFGALATSYDSEAAIQKENYGTQIAALGLKSSSYGGEGIQLMAAAQEKKSEQYWWKASKVKKVKVKVDMPAGVAGIRGTFWEIKTEADGRFEASLLTGEGEITAGGQTVNIVAGQRTEVNVLGEKPLTPTAWTIEEQSIWDQVKEWAAQRAEEISDNQEPRFSPPSAPGEKPVEQAVVEPLPNISNLIDKAFKDAKTSSGSSSGGGSSGSSVPVSGITLNRTNVSLAPNGEPFTLIATVAPSDASNKEILWTSSNPQYAIVKNGIIIPIAQGVTTVYATTVDGSLQASCLVRIIYYD